MKINGQTVKKGYKVTNSYRKSSSIGSSSVYYRLKKWESPIAECGPLAVFKDLKSAKKFCRNYGFLWQIFRCWYVPSKQQMQWNRFAKKHKNTMPAGKDLADAVYLIERVL